jgi:hypothetical protein
MTATFRIHFTSLKPGHRVISVAFGIEHVTEIRGHPRLHGIAAGVSFNAVFTMRLAVSRLLLQWQEGNF